MPLARRVWLPLLAMAAIFWLSSQPADRLEGLPAPFPHADKVFHAVVFGALAACFWWAHGDRRRRWLFPFLWTCCYGVVDEVHQSFVPGRSPDWQDGVADAIGAAIMTAVLCAGRRYFPASSAKTAE